MKFYKSLDIRSLPFVKGRAYLHLELYDYFLFQRVWLYCSGVNFVHNLLRIHSCLKHFHKDLYHLKVPKVLFALVSPPQNLNRSTIARLKKGRKHDKGSHETNKTADKRE